MLIEISEDRYINPLSDNIIGIFPSNRANYEKLPSYVLHIGCQDGIQSYLITKEDRDLLLKSINHNQILIED